MRLRAILPLLFALLLACAPALAADYVPPRHDWARVPPAEAGFDPDKLAAAVAWAQAHGEQAPADLRDALLASFGKREPGYRILGPVGTRGPANGIILRGGRIVAEWGDTGRVDMTFSIAKSYLSILAGLAVAKGLIRSIDDPIRDYSLDAGYEAPQNQPITWRHMLTQTSEWEGSLWDKPDLVDRNRQIGARADNSKKGTHRDLRKPGAYWEYNDVRVNRFAFSLMQVFRRPLPEVLKEEIMDPIGASDSWEWHGYRNSYYEIDGRIMQSVPGGSHWGGGLWINSRDHARFGQLILRRGVWAGRRILPDGWIDDLHAPSSVNPGYGYLWWLNTGRKYAPGAPETSFYALGAGSSIIWIDPQLDLVVVARWIDQAKINDVCTRIVAAITG